MDFIDKQTYDALSNALEETDISKVNENCRILATQFGCGVSFSKLISGDEIDEAEKHQVESFCKNLALLIQKTWAEDDDEVLKQQASQQLKLFEADFLRGQYKKSYGNFFKLVRTVMLLMFGHQSTKDDFSDYLSRIDPELGSFWWFFSSLPNVGDEKSFDEQKIRSLLLVAMTFLANY